MATKEQLLEMWKSARAEVDYAKADSIREELYTFGVIPVVTRTGDTKLRPLPTRWARKQVKC